MFLQMCLAHQVTRHPLFEKLAEKPLSTCGMKMFWSQMAVFCRSTRTFGDLPATLQRCGHADAARLLREIEASESGHEAQLGNCAARFIMKTPDTSRSLRHVYVETQETLMAVNHFERRRDAENAEDSAYWLGATYAVEVMANRSIIPGEIRAFVESGHYGLQLYELGYLAEHAGELGAEANHERLMELALAKGIERRMCQKHIRWGIYDTLARIESFYNGLLRLSLNCPHSA